MFDWEFGRIGDPREDLGYYSHLPVPPNLYEADPQGFLARYRERTGLTEEQVNPQTVSYFYVLGIGRLLGQMFDAADALARGRTPRRHGDVHAQRHLGDDPGVRRDRPPRPRTEGAAQCCPVPRPSRSCWTAAAS